MKGRQNGKTARSGLVQLFIVPLPWPKRLETSRPLLSVFSQNCCYPPKSLMVATVRLSWWWRIMRFTEKILLC
jgi:hypothetical protein